MKIYSQYNERKKKEGPEAGLCLTQGTNSNKTERATMGAGGGGVGESNMRWGLRGYMHRVVYGLTGNCQDLAFFLDGKLLVDFE